MILSELTARERELFACDISAIETAVSLDETTVENTTLTVEEEIGKFSVMMKILTD